MKDVLFFLVPFSKTMFFKMREDGHLFQLLFPSMKWKDVTVDIPLDGSWGRVSEETFYLSILSSYEDYSHYCFDKLRFEYDLEEYQNMEWGNSFKYFKKGKDVIACDDKYNSFSCKIPNMIRLSNFIPDGRFIELRREDVIKEIQGVNGSFKLANMDLYLDENGDLRGFIDNKEFRVSRRTGDMTEVLEDVGIKDSYQKISYDDALETINIAFEDTLPFSLYDNEKAIGKYLRDSNKELQEKEGITLSDDVLFYNNGKEEIYALDGNLEEFLVKEKGLKRVEQGTIKLNEWKRINHLYVLEYESFYRKRSVVTNQDPVYPWEITFYDLDVYKNKGDNIYGYDKKGNCFILCGDGSLETKEKYIPLYEDLYKEKFTFDDIKIDKVTAIVSQAILQCEDFLKTYLISCSEALSERDITLDSKVEFFYDEKCEPPRLFLKDGKGQEFMCKKSGLIPLAKNSIEKNCYRIDPLQFAPFLSAGTLDEDVQDPDIDIPF